MEPSFLLLHVITNEKSLKFTQIGRLLSASRASQQKHVPTNLVGIPIDIYTLVACMLYAIMCNPIHRLYDALLGPYVPVTLGALVSHRYTYVPPRCRTSQHLRTFIALSVSLWNNLGDPVFDGVDWRVSRAVPMSFYWYCCSLPTVLPFSFFICVFALIGC